MGCRNVLAVRCRRRRNSRIRPSLAGAGIVRLVPQVRIVDAELGAVESIERPQPQLHLGFSRTLMRSAMPRFSRLGLLSAWRTGVSEGQPGRRGRRPPDPKPKVIRFAGIVRHRNAVKPTRIDRAEWRARLERGNRIIPSRLPAAGAGTLSPPRGRSVRRPGCPSRDTTRHAGESRPRSPSDSRTAGDPRTPTYRGAYQRGTAKRQETLLLAGDAEAATSHLTRANAQHKSLKLAAVLMLLRVAPGFLRALYQWRDRHVYKVKPGS